MDHVTSPYPLTLAYRSNTQSSITSKNPIDSHGVGGSSEFDDPMDITPYEDNENQSNQTSIVEKRIQSEYVRRSVLCRKITDLIEKWRFIHIPNSAEALTEFLNVLRPTKTHKEAAREVLSILLNNENLVIVSVQALLDLPCSSSNQSEFSDFTGEEPVLIQLTHQGWFEPPEWQVVRAFTCVTCTQEAARQLAVLAKRDHVVPSLSFWKAHDCSCLLSAVTRFQSLDAKQSVHVAWSQDVFCAVAGAEGVERNHIGWDKGAASAPQAQIGEIQLIFTRLQDHWDSQIIELPHLRTNIASIDSRLISSTELDDAQGYWSSDETRGQRLVLLGAVLYSIHSAVIALRS